MNRREFLKIAGASLVGTVLAGCSKGVQEVLTPTPSSPLLSATPGLIEVLREQVISDYRLQYQDVGRMKDSNGNGIVVSCSDPYVPHDESGQTYGFEYRSGDLEWDKLDYPEVEINGRMIPILTSRTDMDPDSIEFLRRWYAEPGFVDSYIEQRGFPELDTTPIPSLLVNYRSIEHDRWKRNDTNTCVREFSDNQPNDPRTIFINFSQFINRHTKGLVSFRATEFVTTEKDFPLTNDPNNTFQDLITVYDRSINYQELSRIAINQGISTVFVIGGPIGMYENVFWTEHSTGQKVLFMGFNYLRTYESAVHSYVHFIEDQLVDPNLPYLDTALKVLGRYQEYSSLPYSNDEQNLRNRESLRVSGREFATAGMGTIHLAPNSVAHYERNSNLPVLYPGMPESIDASMWGVTPNGEDDFSNELAYYAWWLDRLPSRFYGAVRARY